MSQEEDDLPHPTQETKGQQSQTVSVSTFGDTFLNFLKTLEKSLSFALFWVKSQLCFRHNGSVLLGPPFSMRFRCKWNIQIPEEVVLEKLRAS